MKMVRININVTLNFPITGSSVQVQGGEIVGTQVSVGTGTPIIETREEMAPPRRRQTPQTPNGKHDILPTQV